MFVKYLVAGLLFCYVSPIYTAVLKTEDGIGKLKALDDGLHSRITNGIDAEPGQFPHQVSLFWGLPPLLPRKHACGGSIISPEWILTAGHCVTELPFYGSMVAYAGKHLINKKEETEQSSAILKSIVHKSYKGGVNANDIALLKLETPFTLNDRVKPVNLPAPKSVPSGEVVLSGWGSTSTTSNAVMPTTLQTANISIVQFTECKNFLDNMVPKNPLEEASNICSGPIGDAISACSGDSGGPLIQYNSEGKAEIVGIVSWGIMPCGSSGAPSVYTRVSNFVEWINTNIQNN